MTKLDIRQAKPEVLELIAGLGPGDQLEIVDGEKPVATVTRAERQEWPCKAGSAKNTDHWMAPDFDEPLEDFREYME